VKQAYQHRYVVDENSGCWNWIGAVQSNGYGHLNNSGRIILAHRFFYEFYCGHIPKSKLVLHRCDNRICVNPEHLWIGTHKNNTLDMISKERGNFPGTNGERNGNAKLSSDEILSLKEMYLTRKHSRAEIARVFNSSWSTIDRIVRNESRRNG